MPSRPLSPSYFYHHKPGFVTKTRILFLTLTISASLVIIFTIVYFLYHLWYSLVNRSRTIPFDSGTPLKLQRFSYKELKVATNDFDDDNIIGKGGSGTVFRGIARDGKLYAIKRLDTLSLQSEREFQNELHILENGKGKEVSGLDIGGDDWNCKFVPYDDEPCSIDHSKELNFNGSSVVDDSTGSQICPSANPDWDEEKKSTPERTELNRSAPLDKLEDASEPQLHELGFEICIKEFEKKDSRGRKNRRRKNRKMQEWWKEEHLMRLVRKHNKHERHSVLWAPEYGGCGYLMEKADIYSLGVLVLVIVSGRRPLHVLASPMKLEKANLISWCRHLAQAGNILELVDERLKDDYNKEQASMCINLALSCLQKMPELRPDIGEIVKILKGDMDLPSLPFEFSPSPPSKLFSRSRRRQKSSAE
ncbi:hypothetical protein GH714_025363 [Hevea brasiliensis]|uniref:Protein kinase domain-containing protein n=1 Tax=Hevea brasiliensis TaxID=3981 RepID=A0A6A6LKJ2_HEVBR|nr:hypothetical protein GH714_025363 [Hevea brasiliensis]